MLIKILYEIKTILLLPTIIALVVADSAELDQLIMFDNFSPLLCAS
jgi:hypothetical protein